MSNASEARSLLRAHRYGALCTLSKKLGGFPFGSIAPYLTDHDGSLIILISALAEHSKNILHDPRVSLITHNQSNPDIQMQGRVTVAGNAQRIPDQQQPVARYLRHFPEAADFLTLDFSFYRIDPVAIRYIGGVGRVHWLNMTSYAAPQAVAFAQHEAAALQQINARQHELNRLARQYHGADVHGAQATGLDCDGLDLRCGAQFLRLNFAEPLTNPVQTESLFALNYCLPASGDTATDT